LPASLLRAAPLLLRDADDKITYWNRGAELLYGFTKKQALGQVSHDLLRTTFPEPLEQILARIRAGQSWHGELSNLRSDDTRIFVFSQWIPCLFPNGDLDATIELNNEITQRHLAQEARARLAAIVESSDDAIVGKDLRGIITSWNSSAERLFGYRADEIIGQPITRLIPPELQAEERSILERLRRGERVERLETSRLAKNGRLVRVSITVSPIRDEAGAVIGASKIARDIAGRTSADETR